MTFRDGALKVGACLGTSRSCSASSAAEEEP